MSSCTVAGWYWYCDVHDTHGNADSKDEADAIAFAHESHKEIVDGDTQGCYLVVIKGEELCPDANQRHGCAETVEPYTPAK